MHAWRITLRGLPGTVLAAFLFAFSIGQADGGGYLARTGPVPIRFLAAVEPTQALVPAIKTDASENPAKSGPSQPASSQTPTNPTIHSGTDSVTNRASSDASVVAAEPIGLPLAAEPAGQGPISHDPVLVTPQMLVELFTPVAGITNRAAGAIVLPSEVRFNPPEPGNRPSSKATYISK